MILNLSNITEGVKAAKGAINKVLPQNVKETICQGNPDEMYSDTLTYIIDAFSYNELFISLEELSWKFDSEFCNRFKYIKGFHACRIIDETSYKIYGLQGINDERLLKFSIERFSNYTAKEKIVEACSKSNILEYDCGVYFFFTLETTKDPSHNHYLKCGCETLQGVACDLGLSNRGILSSQGRSCVIECNIPIDQIRLAFRYDIWKELITIYFKTKAGLNYNSRFPDWCFSTEGDVEPKYIERFHYIDDSKFFYRLPLH